MKRNGLTRLVADTNLRDVQANFVFFDPKPSDFHLVTVLLKTYLDNKLWDLSGFVDLILGQPTVGTVVKIENDDDDGVYGFVTALNLLIYEDISLYDSHTNNVNDVGFQCDGNWM
ncbi:hypothetical protein CASFOL_036359 [Castilleja foliolosa]|uniref:Uncharacterized protein n=1 Tax=Castilleja foliolosa TaxID=1961234 RepID=A0ABD3BW06_9LAMI